MQRTQISVQPTQFHPSVSAGYPSASRASNQGHSLPANDWLFPTDAPRADNAQTATATVANDGAATDLLAIFIERTAGIPIERFQVATYLVAFFAILGATLMYHGAASTSGIEPLFAAGSISIAVAAATFLGVRTWLLNRLSDTAIEIGMTEAQAKEQSREVMRRLAAPFERS